MERNEQKKFDNMLLLVGSTTKFFDRHLVNFLYFFGSWPRPNQSYLKRAMFYVQIFIAISYLYCMLYSSFFVSNLYIRSNLVSLSIFSTLVMIRVFNFNTSWKGVQSCLTELQNFVLNDEDERSFIKAKMPAITFLSAVFLFSHHFWVLGSMAVPFFISERQLPLHVSFPFDWKHNLFLYVLGYSYGFLGMIALTSMNALTSIFICYVMLMLSLQLDILGGRIKKIGHANKLEECPIDALVDCIKLHKQLDQLIQKIEHFFTFSFLGEIAFGGINICAGAFALSQGSLLQEKVRYINCLYELCVSIIHILLPLYFGNEMILKMKSLSLAVYESNWYEQSQEYRQIVVILLENLKKPRLIFVGHVIPWDLETFTSILKLAYSMFNVLESLKH